MIDKPHKSKFKVGDTIHRTEFPGPLFTITEIYNDSYFGTRSDGRSSRIVHYDIEWMDENFKLLTKLEKALR